MSDLAVRIEALLRDGLSQREVAKRLGCSKMTIHRNRVPNLPPSIRQPRAATVKFPVHPDVARLKTELLAAFVAGRDAGPLRLQLEQLLEKHHPRDQRHPDQLERAS